MYLFLYYIHECFAFMYVCAPWVSWCKKQRVCQILELELWIIVSLQVSAGNWGQVLWNKQQMLLTMEPFLQSPPFFFFFFFSKGLAHWGGLVLPTCQWMWHPPQVCGQHSQWPYFSSIDFFFFFWWQGSLYCWLPLNSQRATCQCHLSAGNKCVLPHWA